MAGGANPAASLLDLMVMTRLQERVWSRDPVVEMLGPEQAEKVRETLDLLAADIWRIGQEYLTDAQMNDVRRLIEEWIEANPQRERVYAVRFDNFTQLRGGEAIRADLGGVGPLRVDRTRRPIRRTRPRSSPPGPSLLPSGCRCC